MRKLGYILLLFLPLVVQAQDKEYRKQLKLMGSAFVITAVHSDATVAYTAIDSAIAEIERIEALISSWDANSQTSQINAQAGKGPVKVDLELFELIQRSIKISELTNGAFDISFSSITPIWHFDGTMTELPDSVTVAESVKLINYKDIVLDEAAGTVFLKRPGMRIGFGALGKGYAADRAAAVMQNLGIDAGVVNAGGDIYCWGVQADGTVWPIMIAHPDERNGIAAKLYVSKMAVVTSGNYEKYVDVGGKRYGHIIDPLTGWPAQGLKSVTIICADTELADALATSVFVLGVDDGLYLIDQLGQVECVLIDDAGIVWTSAGIERSFFTEKEQE